MSRLLSLKREQNLHYSWDIRHTRTKERRKEIAHFSKKKQKKKQTSYNLGTRGLMNLFCAINHRIPFLKNHMSQNHEWD